MKWVMLGGIIGWGLALQGCACKVDPLVVQRAPVNPNASAEARELLAYLYPDQRANMKQYLNATRLLTYGGNGFLPRLFAIENEVMESAESQLEVWDQNKPAQETVADYVKKVADKTYAAIKESFAEILE